jgi:hypothetical protein
MASPWPSRRSRLTSMSSMSSSATMEAARLRGVVNAGVRRHGGQAQGGAQADAVESHLIDAVFHRGNASCRRVPGSIAGSWRLVQS